MSAEGGRRQDNFLPLDDVHRLAETGAAVRQLEQQQIEWAGCCDSKVLVTGESGVGKEVIARLIHERSNRRGVAAPTLASGVVERLISYHWPRNIRELRNVVERVGLRLDSGISVEDVPQQFTLPEPVRAAPALAISDTKTAAADIELKDAVRSNFVRLSRLLSARVKTSDCSDSEFSTSSITFCCCLPENAPFPSPRLLRAHTTRLASSLRSVNAAEG